MQVTWVQSLGWEDSLEEGMAVHSSIPTWRIPMDRGAWRAIEATAMRSLHTALKSSPRSSRGEKACTATKTQHSQNNKTKHPVLPSSVQSL